MKAFLILLALITITTTYARPIGHYAKYCGSHYIEGKKIERSSGRVVRHCLKKPNLGEFYETSTDTYCADGFVPGVWIFSMRDGLDYKECIKKTSIEKDYLTSVFEVCTSGFKDSGRRLQNAGDYETKICIER